MNMHILTTTEEKKLLSKRYEYTTQDVADLSTLSKSLASLTDIMITYCGGNYEDRGQALSVFHIMELLVEPIDRFLSEGAPMQEEATKENKQAA